MPSAFLWEPVKSVLFWQKIAGKKTTLAVDNLVYCLHKGK